MEENKDYGAKNADNTERRGAISFLRDFLSGICIGVGFIIPGFSGGSVAALLGIYERIIYAIANIFKEMKKSIITLLPIGLGLIVGAVSLMYPIGYMLGRYPLPTVSLFVGLAIGGIPSLMKKVEGKPDSDNIIALSVPLALTVMLCFIPVGREVDVLGIGFVGYLLLLLVGILGSCALVVPGISGSMLLLIIGYYNPLIRLITEHLFKFKDVLECVLVLGVFAAGAAVGFFIISVIMKRMLARYPRGTYYAIIGFVIGSVPTVYASTVRASGMLGAFGQLSRPSSPIHYVICLFIVLLGAGISHSFSKLCEKNDD